MPQGRYHVSAFSESASRCIRVLSAVVDAITTRIRVTGKYDRVVARFRPAGQSLKFTARGRLGKWKMSQYPWGKYDDGRN